MAVAAWAAPAQPLPASAAEITLDEGAACAARDDLTFRVERALGHPLDTASPARFLVQARAVKTGFRAELKIDDESQPGRRGFRSLSAKTCDELMEKVALAIALAIGAADGGAELPAGAAGPAPSTPMKELASEESSAPPAAAAESEHEASGPALAASAWVIGDTGTLPAVGWGLGLSVGLGWSAIEVRAVGTLLAEREGNVEAGDPRSPGASIGLLAGGLLACLPIALQQSALELSVCAGGELGALSGSGTNVSTPYHQRTLWAAARFDAVARWVVPQTAFAFEALVTGAAPLSRDEFVLKGIGSVHRPENVLGRAALGVSLSID